MKRVTIGAVLGFVASLALLGAVRVEAQQGDLDHLICYPMKDPLPGPASFDLLARLQPEFSRKGCRLALDANGAVSSQFCVPASKLNVQAPNHDPSREGFPLANDYICYRMECPKTVVPPKKILTDQFGKRRVTFSPPEKICVPAEKEPVPCSTIGSSLAGTVAVPICGGECPNRTDRCRRARGTNECGCVPEVCSGSADSAGVCGGRCPDDLPVCARNDDGRCQCAPPPCSFNASSNQCGGTCPTGLVCSEDVDGCGCLPPRCGRSSATEQCGGACPTGRVCSDNDGECDCLPPPCGLTAGACSGACPAGLECTGSPNGCGCLPPPCGFNAAGNCGGTCPPGFQCLVPPGSVTCGCVHSGDGLDG